jgi:hypothetical protein
VTNSDAILDQIRTHPDREVGWLDLAAHWHDNGDYDLATVLRNRWPLVRESMLSPQRLPLERAIDWLRQRGSRPIRRLAAKASGGGAAARGRTRGHYFNWLHTPSSAPFASVASASVNSWPDFTSARACTKFLKSRRT